MACIHSSIHLTDRLITIYGNPDEILPLILAIRPQIQISILVSDLNPQRATKPADSIIGFGSVVIYENIAVTEIGKDSTA